MEWCVSMLMFLLSGIVFLLLAPPLPPNPPFAWRWWGSCAPPAAQTREWGGSRGRLAVRPPRSRSWRGEPERGWATLSLLAVHPWQGPGRGSRMPAGPCPSSLVPSWQQRVDRVRSSKVSGRLPRSLRGRPLVPWAFPICAWAQALFSFVLIFQRHKFINLYNIFLVIRYFYFFASN